MFIILFALIQFRCESQTISEISPYPLLGIPEWIEIYNPDSMSITLDDYTIEDARSKQVIDRCIIKSRSYLILSKDTVTLKKYLQPGIDCQFMQTALPVLNNTIDKVILRNKTGEAIDSLLYSFVKGNRGKSLERCLQYQDSTILQISLDPLGNTCGFTNSCTPIDNDIQISKTQIINDTIHISLVNNGFQRITNISIDIKFKTFNSRQLISSLDGGDTNEVVFDCPSFDFKYGNNNVFVVAYHAGTDPRRYNDSLHLTLYRSFPHKSIRINEINVKKNGYPEFVECLIMDSSLSISDPYTLIIGKDSINISSLLQYRFLIISADTLPFIDKQAILIQSNGFSLPDGGSTIKLLDHNNYIIDSLNYSELLSYYKEWVETRSLEYHSSSRSEWKPSTNNRGATPGEDNHGVNDTNNNVRSFEIIHCKQGKLECNEIEVQQPFELALYSCDVFSESGVFLENLIHGELISEHSIITIPQLPELINQTVIVRHIIKNFHDDSYLYKCMPFIMRK